MSSRPLSAIAARKAAAQRATTQSLPVSEGSSSASTPRLDAEPTPKFVVDNGDKTRKRKESTPSATSTGPMKKKTKSIEGVAATGSSEAGTLNPQPVVEMVPNSNGVYKKPKRAWSPSQLMDIDDDDEDSDVEPTTSVVVMDEDDDLLDLGYKGGHASAPAPPRPTNVPLSTFRPIQGDNFFKVDDGVIISLSRDDTLTFVGTCLITVLFGRVEIYGTEFTPLSKPRGPFPVYAPRCSPLPVIQQSKSPVNATTPSPNATLSELLENNPGLKYRPDDALVKIQPLPSRSVEGLGKVVGTFDGVFEPKFEEPSETTWGIPEFHPVSQPTLHLQQFSIPEDWRAAMDSILNIPSEENVSALTHGSNPIIALVKGPKRVGKSSFARTLLNRMVTRYHRVAYLDCDIGQSEFSPGGMVTLHVVSEPVLGPSFTHPRSPYAAHFIGSTTPRSNPSHYLNAISALLQTYILDIQHQEPDQNDNDDRISEIVPLIINTQGWVRGMGGDLLNGIEKVARPTHVVSFMDPATELYTFDARRRSWDAPIERIPLAEKRGKTQWVDDNALPVSSAQQDAKLLPVRAYPLPETPLPFSASDFRAIAMMSYFHSSGDSWKTDVSLLATPPYEVDFQTAIDAIVFVGADAEELECDEAHRALNCGVVALLEADELPIRQPLGTLPYIQGAPAPDPTASRCLGLGFIRGLSPDGSKLQIVTPVTPSDLGRCRVLVEGDLELPIWAYIGSAAGSEEWKASTLLGTPWEKVPYLAFRNGKALVGSGTRKARKPARKRD